MTDGDGPARFGQALGHAPLQIWARLPREAQEQLF